MSMNTIRVGIVGAGDNTRQRHIPGLREQPDVEIVAVCNRSRESSQRVADQFGIPQVYTDWRALVTADDIDAVVIGTWPYMHQPVTLAALAADKHVLCEARMAMNATEAREMWQAARLKPHLVAQIVPSPFTLAVDATIRRLIAAGYLGDLLAVEIVDSAGSFVNPDAPLTWRQDADLSGMNIMAMGIWYEALLRWIGPAVRVLAVGRTFVPLRQDAAGQPRAVAIPDHLSIIADMACGAQAHMTFSAVMGLHAQKSVTLFGREGTLRFTDGKLYGGQRDAAALAEIDIPAAERGGWRVEAEFIGAIRGQEPVTHTTFADGVKYMAFTEAVQRSMAQGAAVALLDV